MTREDFEQLVSEWLDAPHDAALRARVEAIASGDAELAALLDQWLRLHGLVGRALDPGALQRVDWEQFKRRMSHELNAELVARDERDARLDAVFARLPDVSEEVDWAKFRAAISARLDESLTSEASSSDARLDALLAAVPGIEGKVNWERFGARVRQAVRPEKTRMRLIRFPLVPAALAASAIAAAVLFMIVLRPMWGGDPRVSPAPAPSDRSFAAIDVSPEDARTSEPGGGAGVAYAQLTVLDEQPEVDSADGAIDENGQVSAEGEIFLVIAAPDVADDADDPMALSSMGM